MLWVVVGSNVLIGLLCLLTAWRLWQFKQRLATAADKLLAFERSVHRILNRAPDVIYKGHSNIHQLRTKYQGLERQWQRATVSSAPQFGAITVAKSVRPGTASTIAPQRPDNAAIVLKRGIP